LAERRQQPGRPLKSALLVAGATVLFAGLAWLAFQVGLPTVSILLELVKEFVIGAGLTAVLLRLGSRKSRFGRLNLNQRIQGFGAGLAVMAGLFIAFPRPGTVAAHVFTAAALAAAVALFALFRELVFVQQGRHTERNFRLLLLLLVFNLGFALLVGEGRPFHLPAPFDSDSPKPLEILLIAAAALQGFRCKWIHYVNRRSKILILLGGAAAFALFVGRSQAAAEAAHETSVAAATLLSSLVMVLAVYTAMTLAGILVHLPSAGLMDRKMREVRTFQALSAEMGGDLRKETLAGRVPALAGQMIDADRVWFELAEGGNYRIAAFSGGSPDDGTFLPAFRTQCREEALGQDKPLLVNDLSKCKPSHGAEVRGKLEGSLLAAPIRSGSGVLGVLYALKPQPFGFTEESQGIFQAFAHQVAISLENVTLVELSIQRGKAEEELRLAHEAQMRLLPQTMPVVPGFEIQGRCITANEIGGDFFDVIAADPDRVDILTGDVSGKGATAAFYMAEFKGAIQALVGHFRSPRDILIAMNGFVRTQCDPDTFLTMVYAVLKPSSRRIRFVRAGHCPVGLLRKGRVEWLEPPGLGLGLVPDVDFAPRCEESELRLAPGDSLFFYTDGLTEARNAGGEEYGEERLARLLEGIPAGDATSMVRAVEAAIQAFTGPVPRHDDITFLIIRALPGASTLPA
jgi:phosphoserine phosphatase RsbU/P